MKATKQNTILMHYYRALFFLIVILLLCLGVPKSGLAFFFPDNIQENILVLKDTPFKVDTLLEISNSLIGNDPEKAFEYCQTAHTIATEMKYNAGVMAALYQMTQINKTKGQLDSAICINRKYIELGEVNNDSSSMGKGYLQMGNLLRRKGDNETAHIYYIKSKNIFTALNNFRGLISVSNALGIIFKNKSLFDSAAYYYLQTIKLCETYNFRRGIGPSMINLGKFYIMIGENSLAKSYNLQSIPYSLENNNLRHVAMAYTNIGIIEMQTTHYDSAMAYFDKAIKIQEQLGNIIGMNNLYINQGNIHKNKKEYTKALSKFNVALKAFDEIGYSTGFITALYSKAEVISRRGLTSKATILFDSCLNMAREMNNLDLQKNIIEKIFLNYKDAGDYKNALDYKIKYFEINDSILSLEKQNFITDLRLKYEKEKDQAQILKLTNENLEKDLQIRKRINQRNIYLFSSIGIILIIFFILIYYRTKTKKDSFIAMQRIRQLEKDKKLISAQFLMEGQEEERKRIAKELHDGIGVLLSTAKMQVTSIDGISPDNLPKINNATKLLEMAASEVRKITHNMMPGLLSKYGFFEAIEDIIDQINETNTIKAELKTDGVQKRFRENKEFMLYRIVQEMINNTLKHAGATAIQILVTIKDHKLILEYSDNGKGFNVKEKFNIKSIGLTSIKSRVHYLGGSIQIISGSDQGTKYVINISTR